MKRKALVGNLKNNPERSAFIKIHVGKLYYKSTDQTMTHFRDVTGNGCLDFTITAGNA